MKRILVVSHCILNTASKVWQDESGLAEEYALRERLLRLVLDQDVQLLQLPCPELLLYGSRRWGHVRSQFDHPFFRASCRDLFRPVLMQLEEYASDPARFSLLGVVSVEGSPTCGHALTCAGDWGGELSDLPSDAVPPVTMTAGPGVFMEIIAGQLQEAGLNLPFLTMGQAAEVLERADKQV